jgi:hypothetical protein
MQHSPAQTLDNPHPSRVTLCLMTNFDSPEEVAYARHLILEDSARHKRETGKSRSQRYYAKKIGMGDGQFSKFIRGVSGAGPKSLLAVAKLLRGYDREDYGRFMVEAQQFYNDSEKWIPGSAAKTHPGFARNLTIAQMREPGLDADIWHRVGEIKCHGGEPNVEWILAVAGAVRQLVGHSRAPRQLSSGLYKVEDNG